MKYTPDHLFLTKSCYPSLSNKVSVRQFFSTSNVYKYTECKQYLRYREGTNKNIIVRKITLAPPALETSVI